MPLLRGLRILEQQEAHGTLKRIIGEISEAIEGGSAGGLLMGAVANRAGGVVVGKLGTATVSYEELFTETAS